MAKRGGKRPNCGRKRKNRTIKTTVSMTEETFNYVFVCGAGNISDGVEQIVIDATVNKDYSSSTSSKEPSK